MVNARYSCSSATTRASSWAIVILPILRSWSAWRRMVSLKPSAGPMARTSGAGFRSCRSPRKLANSSEDNCFPRESNSTNVLRVPRLSRPHIFSSAASSLSEIPSASENCRRRFRYWSVSNWIAGLFVLPIHAIVSFTIQCEAGAFARHYQALFFTAVLTVTRFRGLRTSSAGSIFFADRHSRSRS